MGIISADTAIAIPLAAISIMLIASAASTYQSFLVQYARYSYLQIRNYSISQQIISALASQNLSNAEYDAQLAYLSRFYNISAYMANTSDPAPCQSNFCRVVTVAGSEKILVIR